MRQICIYLAVLFICEVPNASCDSIKPFSPVWEGTAVTSGALQYTDSAITKSAVDLGSQVTPTLVGASSSVGPASSTATSSLDRNKKGMNALNSAVSLHLDAESSSSAEYPNTYSTAHAGFEVAVPVVVSKPTELSLVLRVNGTLMGGASATIEGQGDSVDAADPYNLEKQQHLAFGSTFNPTTWGGQFFVYFEPYLPAPGEYFVHEWLNIDLSTYSHGPSGSGSADFKDTAALYITVDPSAVRVEDGGLFDINYTGNQPPASTVPEPQTLFLVGTLVAVSLVQRGWSRRWRAPRC